MTDVEARKIIESEWSLFRANLPRELPPEIEAALYCSFMSGFLAGNASLNAQLGGRWASLATDPALCFTRACADAATEMTMLKTQATKGLVQ